MNALYPIMKGNVRNVSVQPSRCTGRQPRFARLPHGELPSRCAVGFLRSGLLNRLVASSLRQKIS